MVPSPAARKFLILLASFVCLFYLTYRALFTFNFSGPYAITASVLLYVAECFGIFNLFLFFLQVWRVHEPKQEPIIEGRTVDVLVPTYNEDVALLRATLEACARLDYPHETYVLDDGRRPEVEALAKDLGLNYITRPDNRHFKAGNLNHAIERTSGEYIVVLDADHVPEPHFISRLIGYFRDEKLGYVQTPHAFYNFDSFQARLDHRHRKYWEEGHLFYHVIQPGRNNWGCPIFAGSAAMFRRSALKDSGLIATETITEDLHTGLRMNARGWKSLAISDRLVAGQAAPDITTFHAQRLRWGTGNLSVMRYDNPLFMKGLTLPQRLCYLGSMLHWASGLFMLIIYLTPIAMLFSGIPPVREFSKELLAVILVYLVVSITTMKLVSNGFGSVINAELFAMVNFWTQIKSTFRALFGYGSRIFNVTPKGAKAAQAHRETSVWPFIRPQTHLIILSILALVWGWSRPMLGLSDDLFKPVVPTIWVLLHFWLAYKVTQRAFWPADRRYATRHQVHIPVEYETAQAPGVTQFGVTVDLNDIGMSLVAYDDLAMNDVVKLTIRGAGEVVKCKGTIRSLINLNGKENGNANRYGLQFLALTALQADALNRICLHFGVPRMYEQYDKSRGGILAAFRKQKERNFVQRRTEERNEYHLPMIVNVGTTEDTAQYTTTENLSRSAVAALLDHEVSPHSQVGYQISTPLGLVSGTAKVLRTQPRQFGGKTYYRSVLRFSHFDNQSRTTINSLLSPGESRGLTPALKPDRKPTIVRMTKPTLFVIGIASILVLMQSVFFEFYHQDDYKLRNIVRKPADQLTLEDEKEVDRINQMTLAARAPTTDRLVLLMNALKVYDRSQEQLRVAELLAGRNERDLSLQQTLIYAQMQAQKFAEAEATYARLSEKTNRLREDEKLTLALAGARVAEGKGDVPLAIQRYGQLYTSNPDYFPEQGRKGSVPLRREYAGVLIKGHEYEQAKKVLDGAAPDDLEARRLLVAAYLLRGRQISNDLLKPVEIREKAERDEYEEADRLIADIGKIAERKGDKQLAIDSERMRADVAMARKAWKNAQEIVDKIIALSGGDPAKAEPDLLRRMAQAQLGNSDYAGAMRGFATLLERTDLMPNVRVDVVKGFLDSASFDKLALGDREKQLANKICDDYRTDIGSDAIYLARLGWVLQRVKEFNKSTLVLEQAMGQEPGNAEIRNQLANILIESDNMEQAARVLAGTNAFRGKETLASVHLRRGELKSAKTELGNILNMFAVGSKAEDGTLVSAKDYRRVEMMLGNVLGLMALKDGNVSPRGAFAEAFDYYENLNKKYPEDREVPTAQANLLLWSAERTRSPADYLEALKKYHQVLVRKAWSLDLDSFASRMKVEDGFIDAAASAPSLTPDQVKTAHEIASYRLQSDAADPVPAARLAWVLIRTNEPAGMTEAGELLKKALAAGPTKEPVKRELAGVLAAAKQYKEAASLLIPFKKTVADRLQLAELYAGAHDWMLAKKELDEARTMPGATPVEVARANRFMARVLAWGGEYRESLTQISQLLLNDPQDFEMRQFQADVAMWAKDFDLALGYFQVLLREHGNDAKFANEFAYCASKTKKPLTEEAMAVLRQLTDASLAPDGKNALLLARLAEVYATRIGDEQVAKKLAIKGYELNPVEPQVRKELGYVLASQQLKLYKEANFLLSSLTLTGEDRKYYISIAARAEDFQAARRQARLYVSEFEAGTPQEREARLILADVLTWKGDYEEALSLYEQLLAQEKGSRLLRIKIADANRFWMNYPKAIEQYAVLLREQFESPDLWIGFIDSASSAPDKLVGANKDLVIQIHDRIAPDLKDPRRLSRLAWVMVRVSEIAKANTLLTRAVAAEPQQPAVRKELAGVLAAVDRRREAIDMLTPEFVYQTLDVKDILVLADLFAAEGEMDKAEVHLARFINEKSEKNHRIRYGSRLLWNQKYRKAQEIFTGIARDYPEDLESRLRLAQAYLWGRDYPEAFNRYTELIARKGPNSLNEPEIWRGFVDAAAGTIGEAYRQSPRRSATTLLTKTQLDLISQAHSLLPMMRKQVETSSRAEMEKLSAETTLETRRQAIQAAYGDNMKGLAESIGRLGLLLGLIGDRDRSTSAFGTALAIDKYNRDVWLQYAQALTALKDDVKAKAIFDWLIANQPQPPIPTGLSVSFKK
jgi:cellulose synthase/poly-beta-1,6-N-acetylglucosamine synthase-like glycosyltransferase/thioredoxin-like negative regulator of GroEL